MQNEERSEKPLLEPAQPPKPHGDALAPKPAKARHHVDVEEVAAQMIDAAEAPPNGPLEG